MTCAMASSFCRLGAGCRFAMRLRHMCSEKKAVSGKSSCWRRIHKTDFFKQPSASGTPKVGPGLSHKLPAISGHAEGCPIGRVFAEGRGDAGISCLHLLRVGPARHVCNLVMVSDIDSFGARPI